MITSGHRGVLIGRQRFFLGTSPPALNTTPRDTNSLGQARYKARQGGGGVLCFRLASLDRNILTNLSFLALKAAARIMVMEKVVLSVVMVCFVWQTTPCAAGPPLFCMCLFDRKEIARKQKR